MRRLRLTALLLSFFSIWSITYAEEKQQGESKTYHLRFLTWERSATAGKNTILLFDRLNKDGQKIGMARVMMPAHSLTQKEKDLIEHLKESYGDRKVVFISIESAVPPGGSFSNFPLRMESGNTDFESWKTLNPINKKANKS
jgi:hypothetical protein